MRNLYLLGLLLVACTTPAHAHASSSEFFSRAITALMPDAPFMVDIARCESGLRQFNADGSVLRGGLGGKMIGLFQLHETFHRAAAQQAGHNIDTPLGNISYARMLYRDQGTTPWRSSAHCWHTESKAQQTALEPQPTAVTRTLRYGVDHPEVRLLKDLLVTRGFLAEHAARTHATMFDLATLKALIAFQCAEKIACTTGDVGIAGIGRVSGATRDRINALLTTHTVAVE